MAVRDGQLSRSALLDEVHRAWWLNGLALLLNPPMTLAPRTAEAAGGHWGSHRHLG